MKEIVNNLKQTVPFQWRVQSRTKDKSKAICTAYIDARQVMDILDEHCEWESAFKEIDGFIFAGIGIREPESGETFWRWDCGQRVEEDKADQMYEQAGKSAASDAFKRAAVQWGVGRFLYDLDTVTVPCDQYGNPVDEKGVRIWDLTTHINSLKGKKPAAKVKENTKSVPAANAVSAVAEVEKPSLSAVQYDAMVKAIAEGKIEMVETALPKYKLTLAQNTNLKRLMKDAQGA
jgi:hypothetical protein